MLSVSQQYYRRYCTGNFTSESRHLHSVCGSRQECKRRSHRRGSSSNPKIRNLSSHHLSYHYISCQWIGQRFTTLAEYLPMRPSHTSATTISWCSHMLPECLSYVSMRWYATISSIMMCVYSI